MLVQCECADSGWRRGEAGLGLMAEGLQVAHALVTGGADGSLIPQQAILSGNKMLGTSSCSYLMQIRQIQSSGPP